LKLGWAVFKRPFLLNSMQRDKNQSEGFQFICMLQTKTKQVKIVQSNTENKQKKEEEEEEDDKISNI
jgi:hypothetical protein